MKRLTRERGKLFLNGVDYFVENVDEDDDEIFLVNF